MAFSFKSELILYNKLNQAVVKSILILENVFILNNTNDRFSLELGERINTLLGFYGLLKEINLDIDFIHQLFTLYEERFFGFSCWSESEREDIRTNIMQVFEKLCELEVGLK